MTIELSKYMFAKAYLDVIERTNKLYKNLTEDTEKNRWCIYNNSWSSSKRIFTGNR